MFDNVKWIVIGILVAALGIGGFAAYEEYSHLQAENATKAGQISALQISLDEQRKSTDAALDAVKEWKSSLDQFTQTVQQMHQVEQDSNAQIRRLNDLFDRHDFTALGTAKPHLLERHLDDGTAAAFRLLQCATATANDPGCGAADPAQGSAPAAGSAHPAPGAVDRRDAKQPAQGRQVGADRAHPGPVQKPQP